jgi:hypothetical protein
MTAQYLPETQVSSDGTTPFPAAQTLHPVTGPSLARSWRAMPLARVSCSSRRSATRANRLTLINWYAWDLDWCMDGLVVAAGAYGSAAEALAEWRAWAAGSTAQIWLRCELTWLGGVTAARER